MQAMILAAGRGERLRPLTDSLPKPLAPVAGEPLLVHQLRWLRRAGVQRVVINLHHLGEQIEALVGDGSRFGVEVVFSRESVLLETGGGIVKALPLLGDAPFLLLNGDIYTDFPLSQLVTPLAARDDAHLLLTPTPPHRAHGDFEVETGRVRRRGDSFVYCGISVLHPRLFATSTLRPFSLRDLLFDAVLGDRVAATVWQGYWSDIGTAEQLATVDAWARSRA
jgi:MurNAc alpha-1-phosphate uridylyltransferase